jgi:hypothetical protein
MLGRIRWERNVAHMGEKMNSYRVSVGIPEEKDFTGRLRRNRKITIKIILEV